MKNFYQQVLKKNVFFLLGAAWLFTIAFIIDNYWYSSSSAKYLRRNIENDVQVQEKDFDALLKDTVLLGRLVSQHYSADELNTLTEKPYSVFLYDNSDTLTPDLKFWNTQLVLPDKSLIKSDAINDLMKLRNGQYECIRRQVTVGDNKQLVALALVLVRREYYLEIAKLKREFVNYPQAEKSVSITAVETDYPVKSITGKTLFYLQAKFIAENQDTNWLTLTLNIVAIMLLLIIIHNAAHYFSITYGYLKGILFLIGMVLFLRSLTYIFPAALNLRQYDLFDPVTYSSNAILNSLGDLLINSFLFCWIVLFIRREAEEKRFSLSRKKSLYWLALVFPIIILVVTTFVFASIIKSLIADARISFNVINFFSLVNINSLGGFIVLATLSLSFFFLSQIILQLISPLLKKRKYILFIVIAVTGLILLTLIHSYSFVQLNIYVLLWLLAYVWFMQQHIIANANSDLRPAVSEVLVWLFIFSFSISSIIVIENQRIELLQRKQTAERLANQADPTSEHMLSIALTYFDNDFLFASFDRFRTQTSNHLLKDSLINRNFTDYMDRYDTWIYTFDSSENHKPLFNEDPVSFDTLDIIFRIEGRATNVHDLKYFSKSFDKFSYIFKKTVTDTNHHTIGYFFVLSTPKRYKNDALIPELFRPQKEYLSDYSANSNFAVYRAGRLVDYYYDYPFPTILSPDQWPKLEFEQRKKKDNDELWYRSGDKVVVIVKQDNYLIEGMTLFAYLFSTFLVLLAVFRVFSVLIITRLRWHLLKQYFQVNLRSQIHGTFIFITLISFIVIGVATIFFFINRYKRNNIERLSKAIQIMNLQVQTEIKKGEVFDDMVKFYETHTTNDLEAMVRQVAEIHGTDINFYDLNGNLVVSSNLIVYSKGILSTKMNPQAYYNLHNKNLIQYINDEQMGKVSYQSIYSPVRDAEGNAYAYLNIPSFDSQTELKKEISNFFVTIINLNAFIFLIAGAIALFITNRITSSFTLISNKMRAINLGKTNEEIPWHRNDEIGGLVTEYNKMLNKLEGSAAQLAKSEREGAWREMARQVAHEIKNPLTPMKLSIQYLQKAIDNNSPNVKELTSGVAKTLVEQIDHLSKIAADFSQFANIGNPKSEVFDLHDMLHSLSSLYMATESLEFEWYPIPQRIILFADKTQLNRLFTNLLQNAVEACDNIENKKIVMSEELEGDYIIVKISDNGHGIPKQVQEKIFTPNFTTKSSGTGLGLAMSKNIVEQAKGELWFETKENGGSVFFVKIPMFRVSN
ncbi:MAG: HAMP domain-containing sensor histidine kinase [Bacteroidota bacterium]